MDMVDIGTSALMDTVIIAAVREHAAQHAPRECCGLIVVQHGYKKYIPCRNVSLSDAEFEIDADDYAAAEDAGEIVAVCHSHPFTSPEPSQADRVGCETSGLPWLIVNHPVGHYVEIKPEGYRAPLIGRTFCHGVLDCYTLVQDYYRERLGITLPNFYRKERWWEHGGNLYLDGLESAGFWIASGPPIEHDMLLMRVRSEVPNHAAVYHLQGKRQLIMHHLQGRLSSRDVYGGWYQKNTTHVCRHKDVR